LKVSECLSSVNWVYWDRQQSSGTKRVQKSQSESESIHSSLCWLSQYTFFNPDYTVGSGISPDPVLSHPRTVTADREFHPAL